ncbi:MAG: glycogen synthase GlgA [Christensenellaceae bacterium]|jgi:starch synthase|nr:glycogen synthase GlgA [Christensenellaceae bacterium]
MKVLYAAAEAAPFIRTGGLGDVAGALPAALVKNKIDARVVLPLYADIPESFKNGMLYLGSVNVPLGWRNQYAGLFKLVYNNTTYYFIDNEFYFKKKGLYGYFDDGERFAFFSKAILELLPLMDFYPDVIHVNDWQTALVPTFLDAYYRNIEGYANIKTLLSIHNIEFQGNMDKYCILNVFGLPTHMYQVAEYKGDANMLKAGIESSNRVATVSPTYATEILNPYYAYGLSEILEARKYKLCGITNGIDTELYNPLKDKSLFQAYSVKSLARRKKNKTGLQTMLGLPECDKPVIGMITRLTAQKGIDLVFAVSREIMDLDIQLVILGTGDWKYENGVNELNSYFANKFRGIINFSSGLASQIYAGSDMFLMPSRFEPCGLSQMIAMRYGAIPIVRETGGLRDTVEPFNPVEKTGDGFTFKTFNAYDMLDAIKRAVTTYYNKEEWSSVVNNAMNKDFSWKKSAQTYAELYNEMVKG